LISEYAVAYGGVLALPTDTQCKHIYHCGISRVARRQVPLLDVLNLLARAGLAARLIVLETNDSSNSRLSAA
jgi:hypothetical protein